MIVPARIVRHPATAQQEHPNRSKGTLSPLSKAVEQEETEETEFRKALLRYLRFLLFKIFHLLDVNQTWHAQTRTLLDVER